MSDIIFGGTGFGVGGLSTFCRTDCQHFWVGSSSPTSHVPKTQQPASLANLFDTSSRQKNTRMAQTIRAIKNPAEAGWEGLNS